VPEYVWKGKDTFVWKATLLQTVTVFAKYWLSDIFLRLNGKQLVKWSEKEDDMAERIFKNFRLLKV